jgi:hypothetical protein
MTMADSLDLQRSPERAKDPPKSGGLRPATQAPKVLRKVSSFGSLKPLEKHTGFSPVTMVRVYSLERITELDAGALGGSRGASMVGGEMSVDGPGPMKQADGPSHAAGHADRIINTFFDHKTRTPAELRERIGAERCAEIAAELPAIRARFVQLLARLSTVGDGAIALLPSNAKLDATHAPWIRKIAGWCENWPPPEPKRAKASGAGCCASPRR